ncbi:SNF2-related protein [Agrilactobacillus fermenti]|uniref:SNF2-related protein n=1 Tax=Agrilactobacillus fermenti TaxID=2586909 RepID=UPI003A5BB89F
MKIQAKLHQYQAYSVEWILDHPYCALLLDMGLGKTLSSLTAIDDLLEFFGDTGKILVIAPLTVARSTWPSEIKKWDHTKGLTYSLIVGKEQQRIAALEQKADVYITNRESVVWLVEHFKQRWPFETVIIDELSSFKSAKSKRFRALKQVRPLMKRVIGLTGTPAPNSLMDLWPQIYLLDRGKRLGKTITEYRNKYFHAGVSNGHVVYNWILNDGAEEKIYAKLDDICISMKSKDYLTLPPRTDNVVKVQLSSKELRAYRQLERDYILENDGGEIVASNAAVLAGKLLQVANGAIYDENEKVRVIHDRKLKALENIIEEAQGQPVLVFYNFKHDLSRIQKAFPEAKVLDVKSGDVEKWNQGKIPILLVQPQSAGHGLNLQQGGHIIVWFSLTWSLEYYQQANARLDRQGQTQPVIVHHLVTEGTIDEDVMKVLSGKAKNQNELLQALKARVEGIRRNKPVG